MIFKDERLQPLTDFRVLAVRRGLKGLVGLRSRAKRPDSGGPECAEFQQLSSVPEVIYPYN